MRYLPLAFTFALFFSRCSSKHHRNDERIELINKRLERTVRQMHLSTETLLESFKEMKYQPVTAAVADRWEPGVRAADSITRIVLGAIQTLKKKIKENPETDAVQDLLVRQKEVVKLQSLLRNHIGDMARIEPGLFIEIVTYARELQTQVDSSGGAYFRSLFESDCSPGVATALLSQLELEIEDLLHRTVGLIGNQFSRPTIHYSYHPLLSQSTSRLRSGDTIFLRTGIGSYLINNDTRVRMNGRNLPITEWGIGFDTIRASGKPGLYRIPVHYEWKGRDGTRYSFEDYLRYTIIEN